MTPGQFSLLAASVAMVVVTYLYAPLISPQKRNPKPVAQTEAPASFDYQAYRAEAFKVVAAAGEPLPDSVSHRLNHIIDSMETVIRHAYSLRDNAEKLNLDSAWANAGEQFHRIVSDAPSVGRNFDNLLYVNTIYCYEKALSLNPENDSVKINLGAAYIRSQGSADQVMKGVKMLLDITEKDPGNVTANYILGENGIVSGQFDKAAKRFEKVLAVDSLNANAYLYLAQAYERLGEKEKAVRMLEKCSVVVNDPQFTNDIRKRIEQIKNS